MPKVPFTPMPMDQQKARFPLALRRVFDARNGMLPDGQRPGETLEHVFDFEEGVRYIVSKDYFPGRPDPIVHISVSAQAWFNQSRAGNSLPDFESYVLRKFDELSDNKFPRKERVGMTMRAIHWLCYES